MLKKTVGQRSRQWWSHSSSDYWQDAVKSLLNCNVSYKSLARLLNLNQTLGHHKKLSTTFCPDSHWLNVQNTHQRDIQPPMERQSQHYPQVSRQHWKLVTWATAGNAMKSQAVTHLDHPGLSLLNLTIKMEVVNPTWYSRWQLMEKNICNQTEMLQVEW